MQGGLQAAAAGGMSPSEEAQGWPVLKGATTVCARCVVTVARLHQVSANPALHAHWLGLHAGFGQRPLACLAPREV